MELARHYETSSREYGSFTHEHADCLNQDNHRGTRKEETGAWMVFLFKSHVPTVTGRCREAKLGARSSARCSTIRENVVEVKTLCVSAHPADQQ